MKGEKREGRGESFSKAQLTGSAVFKKNADLLNAVLKADERYTVEQVREIVEKYMKGKVV